MSELSHMTDEELREHLYDCDDSRKELLRFARKYHGGVMPERDKETFLAIEEYAMSLFKEIMRRRGPSSSSSPTTPKTATSGTGGMSANVKSNG